jgi:hypothetical protein
MLLDCIAQEYAALQAAAALQFSKAGEGTAAHAGSSSSERQEPANCNAAEEQA